MGTQHTVAKPVEGADPHRLGVDGHHGTEPGEHFARGFVGKGDSEQALRAQLRT